MKIPVFSIIIANYNYGRFLEEAIMSVIAQKMGDAVELIICDAASADNSVEVIKKYAYGLPPKTLRSKWNGSNDEPQSPDANLIAWWCSEKDGGQSAAFNKGFSHARGRFLTWLNADDVLLPGSLTALLNAIDKNPHCTWWIGSSVWCDSKLRVKHYFCSHRFSKWRARNLFLMVGGPSSFFTKEMLLEAGGMDEGLHFLMDIDLWHRFYRQGRTYKRIRNPIFAYRIHADSKMSGADVSMDDGAQSRRKHAAEEGMLIRKRYALTSSWVKRVLILLSTFSLIDRIVSLYKTYKLKGTTVYGEQ